MSISEIAKRVNRSTKTVRRWANDGVNIFDESELLAHAEFMDCRARGAAAKMAIDRPSSRPVSSKSIASYFAGVGADDFVDLPAPCGLGKLDQALAIMTEIKTAFTKRIEELRPIKHEESISLAADDLTVVSEAHRLVGMLVEAFVF